MSRRGHLAFALAASLGLHIALVAVYPETRWFVPVRDRVPVEVELVRPEPPPAEPEPPPEPPEPPPPEPLAAREAAAVLDEALTPALTAPPPRRAPPPVRLPARRPPRLPEPTEIPWVRPAPRAPAAAPVGPLPEVVPEVPGPSEAPARARDLLARLARQRPEPQPEAPPAPLEIEWQEGAERRLVAAPPVPRVRVVEPVTVRIRFWVSPRGEVTQTLVVQRGSAELDRVARDYVSRLRFNPLPPGDDTEQWGTVTLRFVLE